MAGGLCVCDAALLGHHPRAVRRHHRLPTPGRDAEADEWGLDLDNAETPRFPGRGVVALAADPEVLARAGRIYTTRQMADAYGFTDVDGNLPSGAPDPATHYPLNVLD